MARAKKWNEYHKLRIDQKVRWMDAVNRAIIEVLMRRKRWALNKILN